MMSLNFLKDPISNRMKILFFAKQDDEAGQRLRDAVQRAVPVNCLESYGSLDDFSRRLRAARAGNLVSVLLASDRQELEGMQGLKELLKDTHVILVIPDQEERTVALAHHLLPRFLRLKCGDFKDVESVLGRIVR